MVFDGDCNFCGLWIRRWRQLTGDAVDYLPSQDPQIALRFTEIPREAFQTSVQLIEPDGTVFSGAEAVFRALAKNPNIQWPLNFYHSSGAIASGTERAYALVARHRTAFSLLTRLAWGGHVERPDYFLTRWFFLRALGAVFLVAFLSLSTQISGLIGHHGILPADRFMAAVRHLVPTLCWFGTSDGFLRAQCVAGVVLACLLIVGIAPVPALALLWLLYLSLVTVGRDFLGFQWDNLLLETGFLSIFLAPRQLWPGIARETPPSRIVLWLLRLLLFKLMFSSGCVKLASGDPNWRNLTALTFHYQTQPLPTWLAWYASQLPLWFQKTSCALMFAIELGAPLLIFFPRRIRFFGGSSIVVLQVLILLTGNYTFFNYLTLALCLLLFDDFSLKKFVPRRFARGFAEKPGLAAAAPVKAEVKATPLPSRPSRWTLAFTVPLAIVFVAVSFLQIVSIPIGAMETATGTSVSDLPLPKRALFYFGAGLSAVAGPLAQWLDPFRTVNGYGLFAVMTTERHEIIVQGSNDGVHWRDYQFKYKPGNVTRRPVFVAPFQPRLDWQMWFAALGQYQDNPWFGNFCLRLLQGSPQVLALLETDPFPTKPPRYIRAELYNYEFTTFSERRETGAWWKRQYLGEYLPPISLPPVSSPIASVNARGASAKRQP